MKNFTMRILFLTFFMLINSPLISQINSKNESSSFTKDIVAKLIRGNRIVSLNQKNNTIEINQGSKLKFESSNLSYQDSYLWDLGDGFQKKGKTIDHQYNKIGEYSVRLKRMDQQGIQTIVKLNIKVNQIIVDSTKAFAPIIAINDPSFAESTFDLQQLVENVLIEGDCASVDNFETLFFGEPEENTRKSYGYFERGSSNTSFPFENGIILTTGNAFAAGNTLTTPGPGNDFPDFDNSGIGDADIENALGLFSGTNDATFVKFNFTAISDTISFRYLMASEEYDPNYECDFSDGFAFLLRELGATNYTNIAVLPDGTPISVTRINNNPYCGMNQAFFEGYEINDTNYFGRTKVLTATASLIPGTTYEIKLVVADDQDSAIDGAVFIEGNSFNLGIDLGEDITIANGSATCDSIPRQIETDFINSIHTWSLNGVEIPGETSNIISISEPGTYSVEINNGGSCIISDTIIIEFLPNDDASFTLLPECNNSATATITGSPNGTFSFNPEPSDGAIINANSGEITNGVSGTTYSVDYLTSGPCPNTSNQSVTIPFSDDASFTLTPSCDNSVMATITGSPSGTFSFNPEPSDGAIIDANSGEITNGVPGATYTVMYITSGICPNTFSQNVTLLLPDDASFILESSCNSTATATITGLPNGTFSFNPEPLDGATIGASSGQISNGVPGTTYTVQYSTISSSGICPNTSNESVTILEIDDASFSISGDCDQAIVTITGLPGGLFSFNPVPTDGAILNTSSGEISNGVPGATYTVEYRTQGTCSNLSSQTVTLLDLDDPTFTLTADCFSAAATITGLAGGIFNFNPEPIDDAVIDPDSGEITNGFPGTTYSVQYTTQGECPNSLTLNVTLLIADCLNFEIPDGFSPNNDGVNDTLELPNAEILYPNFNLEVYNRYGNVVYKGNAATPRFDGKSDQTEKLLPVGIYFYIFTFNDNVSKPQQGTLYISR